MLRENNILNENSKFVWFNQGGGEVRGGIFKEGRRGKI
jgi:hypothetical protein